MTVAELIEKLQAMPQDAEVVVDYDAALDVVDSVAVTRPADRDYLRNDHAWPDADRVLVELGYAPPGL